MLFSPELDNNFPEQIKKKIIDLGGSILNEKKDLSEKEISYPINKKTEGIYYNLKAIISPEKIEKINDNLKSEKDILRYMITKEKEIKAVKPEKDAIDMKIIDKIEPIKEIKKSKKDISEEKPKPVQKEKVKIEELDKKLSEILNQ